MRIGNSDYNFTINNAKEYKESNLFLNGDSREAQFNVGENQLYPLGKPLFGSGVHKVVSNIDGSTTVGIEITEEEWEKLKTVVSNIDGDTWFATLKRPKGYTEGGIYYGSNEEVTPEALKEGILDYVFRAHTTDVIHIVISKQGTSTPASRLFDKFSLIDPFYGVNPNSTQTIDLDKVIEEYNNGEAEAQKAVAEGVAKVVDNIAKVNEHLTEQEEAAKEATGDTEGGDASLLESLKASILTQDGERVEIDINMYMRREHIESEQAINMLEKLFTEPLEINYDGTAESLTGEDFNFIIDFGEGENEADSSLRIISNDKFGNKQVFTLQERDIDAIYIDKSDESLIISDNTLSSMGLLQKLGFYLKENIGKEFESQMDYFL